MAKKNTLIADFANDARKLAAQAEERGKGLRELYAENLEQWVTQLKVKVDSNEFDFNAHTYLRQPYRDRTRVKVVMKAAQMGFTIFGLLETLFECTNDAPYKAGYYLPGGDLAEQISKDRFDKLCRDVPSLDMIMREGDTSNVRYKQFGESTIFFTYIGGKVSTESHPLDKLVFDELRRMATNLVNLAEERISHSRFKRILYISTAGFPENDIHARFLESDQGHYNCRCQACGHFFRPDEEWPNRVQSRKIHHQDEPEWGIICPKCKHFGVNRQEGGEWIPEKPGHEHHGYHISQLSSMYIALKDVMKAWFDSVDKGEFYRSKLGLPYLDPSAILVRPNHLSQCEDHSLVWGSTLDKNRRGIREGMDRVVTVLGLDQMEGFNVIVVKEVTGEGYSITRHLEYVIDDDPWVRSAEIMHEYDIDVAVVDHLPNANEAKRFAKLFPGRVWLADYTTGQAAEALWKEGTRMGEKPTERGERSVPSVALDRLKMVEYSLRRFSNRMERIPDPKGLTQFVRAADLIDRSYYEITSGAMALVPICWELFYKHLQKLVKIRRPKLGKSGELIFDDQEYHFENLGVDPHFAHANVYADAAMMRALNLAKHRRGPAEIWNDKPEDDGMPKVPTAAMGGIQVAICDPRHLPPGQTRCPGCDGLFHYKDTRMARITILGEGEVEDRFCLNCIKGEDVVTAIPEKRVRPYKRRKRPGEEEDGEG